jgi:tetratricopeptide (TPR) repeat protein
MKAGMRTDIAVFLLMAALASLLYANSLQSPFIWDDHYLIIENHFIKSFSYIPDIFKHHLYYSSAGVSNFYRPLQSLILMLDHALWKGNVTGYHVTSVVFHILCAFFAYMVIGALFGRKTLSFLASLLFLVHPANSTVVNYISSRADSQATLFILLCILFFVKYSRDNRKKALYGLSLASFVLALLSKEMAVMLPLLILLSAPFALAGKKITGNDLKPVIPYLFILGIYAILRFTVLDFSYESVLRPAPLYIRLLTSAESFVRLTGIFFAPVSIHIEKAIPFSKGLFQSSTLFSLAALLLIGGFMYWVRKRSAMCLFGLGWFFISLLPMSNIVPLNATIADHWLYLASIGLSLALIGGWADLVGRKKLGLALYAVIAIVLSLLTIKQNTIWQDPFRFYQSAIKNSPGSYRAHNEIGLLYMHEGMPEAAIASFKKAVEINPRFDQAYDNLGIAYDKQDMLAKAIAVYKKALEINPDNPKLHNNLGNAYNRSGMLDEAIASYERAISMVPGYKTAYNNMGAAYYKKGMYDKARWCWEKTLRIDPDFASARSNLRLLAE